MVLPRVFWKFLLVNRKRPALSPGCTRVSRSRYYPGPRGRVAIPGERRAEDAVRSSILDGEVEFADATDQYRVQLDYVFAATLASAWRNDGRRRRWSPERRQNRAFDRHVMRMFGDPMCLSCGGAFERGHDCMTGVA